MVIKIGKYYESLLPSPNMVIKIGKYYESLLPSPNNGAIIKITGTNNGRYQCEVVKGNYSYTEFSPDSECSYKLKEIDYKENLLNNLQIW